MQPSARALSFNVTFDDSTNGAPAGFFTAFNNAIQFYETNFADPITINLQVGWGELNGQNIPSNDLGESSTNGQVFSTFAPVKSALISDAKSASDATSVANMPATDPTGGAFYAMSLAEAKALGLKDANAPGIDGFVGFNSTTAFTFDPNNRAVPNKVDFIGIAEHEISEVMGRYGLGQNFRPSGRYSPIDFFRYSSPGTLDLVPANGAYFSIDGGNTVINTFNGTGGGDLSDWAGATSDSYNAFITGGVKLPVSSGDITEMDVIGYDLASIWSGGGGNGNWSTAANWSTAPSNGSSLTFAGVSHTMATNNSLTSVGSIAFDNTAGSFTLSGNALTISGGITNFSANTQTVNLSLNLSAAQQFNADSGNIAVSGSVSGTGGITKTGASTLTLSGNNSYSGGTTVSAGTLTVGNFHALGGGGLAITNSAATQIASGMGTVVIPSLNINGGSSTPTATFDIGANSVVIPYSGVSPFSTIKAQVLYAAHNLAYDRPGITSSSANGFTTALGYAEASELFIDNGGTYVNNQSPSQSGTNTVITNEAVILKYTWLGDVDLDGDVDAADFNIVSGFLGTTSGADWSMGDLDGNGIVDSADFNLLTGNLGDSGLTSDAVTPVPAPEPSTLVLTALGLAGLVAWRRQPHLKFR